MCIHNVTKKWLPERWTVEQILRTVKNEFSVMREQPTTRQTDITAWTLIERQLRRLRWAVAVVQRGVSNGKNHRHWRMRTAELRLVATVKYFLRSWELRWRFSTGLWEVFWNVWSRPPPWVFMGRLVSMILGLHFVGYAQKTQKNRFTNWFTS